MGPARCPFCKEVIEYESERCFFCGSKLYHNTAEYLAMQPKKEEQNDNSPVNNKRAFILKHLFLVFFICFILLVFTLLVIFHLD